jgi:hypothetical protein
MKKLISSGKGTLLLLLLALGFSSQVSAKGHASKPGQHPAYLHALSNLRAARWLIEHRPGNWQQTNDEMEAVKRIDAAIAEIKKAAIEDGKNLEDHPGVEDRRDHGGRLRLAIEYLRKAHADVDKEEDNGFAQGLRARAMGHIDGAIRATEKAIAAGKY